ncbi:hypothetical protein CAEBREN_14967 [Caenorhabditis brenneri]|uniref:Uncharacterized protein n=1 Tax=Caenorhabditis brenneri TaxID=135651 RepID=G0NJZ6_CAEBE|nr:hypothetical protein CAEBREN_14967 [Caenorhabditis brenneri]
MQKNRMMTKKKNVRGTANEVRDKGDQNRKKKDTSLAPNNNGSSTSVPPPDFQLEGLDGRWYRNRVAREVRYQRETWDNSTSESPESEEQIPEDPEEEEEDDRPSSSSGSSNSSTSLEQYQRAKPEEKREPRAKDKEEDQAGAASAQETEVDHEGNKDEDDGPQPLGWLSRYVATQLFKEPLPYQGHAGIHEEDAPVLHRGIPHGKTERKRKEDEFSCDFDDS